MAARVLVTLRMSQASLGRYDELASRHGVTRAVVIRTALSLGEAGVDERLRKLRARIEAEEQSP